jgi:hypothetical protein
MHIKAMIIYFTVTAHEHHVSQVTQDSRLTRESRRKNLASSKALSTL